ncbi:MAG: zinc-ribbon domain-containing protein [Candidatus Helarchaeota archaeon]
MNEQQTCQNCKKPVPKNASFCPYCGLKLKIPVKSKKLTRICQKCGAQIDTLKLSYCPLCLTEL